MSKEIQKYINGDLGISYDPNICTHAANCVNNHPQIFNIDNNPWVNINAATEDKINDAINNCPSGALKKIGDSGTTVTDENEGVQIDIMSKGPLIVKGSFKITDYNGNVIETKDKAALCRCGASQNKPFCDGAHSKTDFEN